MDKLSSQEDAERFLRGLGLTVSESVVRKVVGVVSGQVKSSLRRLYAGKKRDGVLALCGKGTVTKIRRLYQGGTLKPYLAYLECGGTVQPASDQAVSSRLTATDGFREKPKARPEALPRTPARNLEALSFRVTGTMHGRGLPMITEDTQYWVIRVRLENLSDVPISFGDLALQIARKVAGDSELHICHHVGRDTYGSHAGIPLADEALDIFISLTPERPVVTGALRFQDPIPFGSEPVRLTLVLKGTGPYSGAERSWEIPQ